MKLKLIISIGLIAAFTSVIINACSKHQDYALKNGYSPAGIELTEVPSDLLQAAKSWHAAQTGNAGSNLANLNKAGQLTPNWNEAKLQKLKNGNFLIVVSGPVTKVDSASPFRMVRKFLFGTDGKNITNGVITEVYGKADYVNKNGNFLLERYNDNEASDFSGSVIIYDLNYRYIFSNVVKNGLSVNATAKVSYNNGNLNVLKTDAVGHISTLGCYDYYLIISYTDGSSDVYYLGRGCDSGGGSEGGGGGGGSPAPVTAPTPPPPPPGKTGPGDHPLKGKLPSATTQTQVANLCTFTVMSYVSTFLGRNTDVGTFLLTYCQTFNASMTDVVSNGITTGNFLTFLNQQFNEVSTTDVLGAINANNAVMATINNGTHEVFITGYNNDNSYQYFDPSYGQYYSAPVGSFTNVVKVTGQK